MPDWQERITRETAPAIRVEHELRYAAAAPIVHTSAAWADLGCGTGLAAAAGLATAYDGCALLVDVDESAVEQARSSVEASTLVGLAADLADPSDLARVRTQLLEAADGSRCVTCFETIEHLTTFAPLVELLVELAANADCTVVASVPNDAFWAIENPHHATSWGEGAVEELRSLLPAGHVLAHQVALQGSALTRAADEATREVAEVAIAQGVPSHFVLAFGPRADALGAGPRVVQADPSAQRRWERQRESDLAYAEARIAELEAASRPAAATGADDAA